MVGLGDTKQWFAAALAVAVVASSVAVSSSARAQAVGDTLRVEKMTGGERVKTAVAGGALAAVGTTTAVAGGLFAVGAVPWALAFGGGLAILSGGVVAVGGVALAAWGATKLWKAIRGTKHVPVPSEGVSTPRDSTTTPSSGSGNHGSRVRVGASR